MKENNNIQAVILCGGLGRRLKSVVDNAPKPMAMVGDKPFLEHIVNFLQLQGFRKFLFLTGYKSEAIEEYFKDRAEYSREKTLMGTAGALLNAFDKLEDEFFLLNGDTFFDIDYEIFTDFINTNSAGAAIALYPTTDTGRCGFVDIDDNFIIKNFIEKSQLSADTADGYINSGIYYFKKSLLKPYFSAWDKGELSLEKDVFPNLIQQGALKGLPLGGFFIDIGIPEDYALAQNAIVKRLQEDMRPALFIDRDGTIIEDSGYVHGEDLVFIEDTIEFVRKYKNMGYRIFVVTNQAGVAKGKFKEEDVVLTNHTIAQKYKSLGIEIDDFAYCPYHQDGIVPEYAKKSVFRKPNAGMLLYLGSKYKTDYKNSLMYGDNHDIDRINLPYIMSVVFEKKKNV